MNQREQAAIADRIASLARRLVPDGSKTHSKGYTDLDAAAGLPIGWTGVTIDRQAGRPHPEEIVTTAWTTMVGCITTV